MPSVLDLIGDTPLVEVTQLDAAPCRLFLKLESANPSGSIKDRPARAMIELAETNGRLKPGGGEWTGLDGTAGPHMLTQGDIGRLLRPFAIRSKTLWPPGRRPGTKSESGYSRQQFEAAWASYCEPSATPP
jgi:hypothetical protein